MENSLEFIGPHVFSIFFHYCWVIGKLVLISIRISYKINENRNEIDSNKVFFILFVGVEKEIYVFFKSDLKL